MRKEPIEKHDKQLPPDMIRLPSGRKKKSKPNIRSYVREAMADAAFNQKAAAKSLITQASTDPTLRDMLIELGVDQAIRTYFGSERREAGKAPTIVIDGPEAEKRREEKIKRRLFWDRYALFGQLPLKQATKPDLANSVLNRRTQAAGNIQCANFEEDIMGRMRGKRTVGEQLTIKEIVEIAEQHHVIE